MNKNPFLFLSLFCCLGILYADFIKVLFLHIIIFFVFVSFLFFISLKRTQLSFVFLMFLFFLTGALRYVAYNHERSDSIGEVLKNKYEKMQIIGKVVNDPIWYRTKYYVPYTEIVVEVKGLKKGNKWYKYSGKIQGKVFFSGKKKILYLDELFFSCKIRLPENYGDFDYREYLLHKKIYGQFIVSKKDIIEKIPIKKNVWDKTRRSVFKLKSYLKERMQIMLSRENYSIIAGMIFGDRRQLDIKTKELFVNTGTMHILAISGLHITIISLIVVILLQFFRVPRGPSMIITMILLLIYLLMVAERASVWRAVLMTEVLFMAKLLRYEAPILNVLCFSFFIMIIVNPNYIFDVGFILSYMCVFSIIVFMPIFEFYIKKIVNFVNGKILKQVCFYFFSSIAVSVSVFLGVLPLLAYYFHMIAPAFIIANFFAIPLCFLIIAVSIIAILCPFAGGFFFQIINLSCIVLLGGLHFTQKIFPVYEIGNFSVKYIILYYLIIAFIIKIFRGRIYKCITKNEEASC